MVETEIKIAYIRALMSEDGVHVTLYKKNSRVRDSLGL